jgi:hypothetical protein
LSGWVKNDCCGDRAIDTIDRTNENKRTASVALMGAPGLVSTGVGMRADVDSVNASDDRSTVYREAVTINMIIETRERPSGTA